jgi:hypothetical protein
MDRTAFTAMNRRTFLQTSGAAIAAAASAGCAELTGDSKHLPRNGTTSSERDRVSFDDSEELLLNSSVLPGKGWKVDESVEPDLLDAGVLFQYEFEEGETLEGESGDTWSVYSFASGCEDEADAARLYKKLYTDWSSQVGEARIMNLDLATEAAIAGYDGTSAALLRDVNCVGLLPIQNCASNVCRSDVAQTERFARLKRQSWREGATTE